MTHELNRLPPVVLLISLSLVAGCGVLSPVQESLQPFKHSLTSQVNKARDAISPPLEAQFFNRVYSQCAHYRVGQHSLGALLTQDKVFYQLMRKLYQGVFSSDTYIAKLLKRYPAADGNVPAVGCVIDQMNACLSGNCILPSADTKSFITPMKTDTDTVKTPQH
ncbi:hypothetical protein HUU62_17200 [Rhodoferax sp. 4810]|nr:hypothetical protein [Rhodoferax jenense]